MMLVGLMESVIEEQFRSIYSECALSFSGIALLLNRDTSGRRDSFKE